MTDEHMKPDDEAWLTELVQTLVRIPTQNPPGHEKACAEFIHKTLTRWGVEAELISEPYPHRPQVLAVVHGKAPGRTLIFNGHIDVVPEGSRSAWSDDPYGGVLRDGKIYGRGSSDMKGGVALMMALAKRLREDGVPRGEVYFQFAVGEETGEPGTKQLLAVMSRRGIRGDYGIVVEPTAMKVTTAEKGLAWFRITLEGKPVHGSVAETGINAIEKAMKLQEKLIEYDRALRTHVHPLLGARKCSTTMIQAGTKENIIPESCSLVLDRRFNPDETPEGAERELNDILEGLALGDPDFKYRIERTMVYEPAEIPIDSPVANVLRKFASQVTGAASDPCGIKSSTDVRNFILDAGIPAVTFGPGDATQAHTFNEYIEIRPVVDCMKVLLLALEELL